MYQNKMVVSLKSKEGKIIREQGDIVQLPFGSEYSIYIKNLESRKAKVKVAIDGEDVLDGKSLLVGAGESVDLEGFLKDNIARNCFKFIEKTQEISDFRGDKAEDGLIRIEWYFEKMKPVVQPVLYNNLWYTKPVLYNNDTYYTNTGTSKSLFNNNSLSSQSSTLNCQAVNCSLDSMSLTRGLSNKIDYNDAGITVKGSEINQQFKYGNIGELEEQPYTMVIRLKGFNNKNDKVEKLVTVNDKKQCSTCGRMSKSDAKYCYNCGTYLE